MKDTGRLLVTISVGGLALACSPFVPPLSAQTADAATLQGRVLDAATSRPLAGVLVQSEEGALTLSDEEGRFRLEGLEPGSHLVALLTPGCSVTWADVELESGEVRDTVVRLEAAEEAARTEERADRRRRSQGKVVTGAEIREMQESSLAEVIRRVAPNMVGSPSGQFGRSTSVQGRTRNSFLRGAPEPVVVVDGVRVEDPADALDFIRPADVRILEILPGAAGGWEFGSEGAAGVIRVTTSSGGAERSPPGVEGCSVPDFPRG